MIRFCQRNASMSIQDILSIMSAAALIGSLDSLLHFTLFFIFKKDNTLQLTPIFQDSTCQDRTFIKGYKN